jgi:iron complex transport system substrate-binding protein
VRTTASKLLVLVLAASLLSCTGSPSSSAARGRSDGPRRIVSLAPAITEILFALGLGERVVGVTAFCDYPEAATRVPKVGGYTTPSIEAIVGLHPDLVVMSPAVGNREVALALERAGLRVEIVRAETLEEAYAAIEQVGRICGEMARGRDLSAAVRSRVEAASREVASLPRVRTLFCVQREPLIVAGRDTLPSQLLELAGGINVAAVERYPRVGIETVIGEAPAVIVQSRMDASATAEERQVLEFWRRWPAIPAVRDGKVFVIDGTTAFRAGPRVGEAVEMLSKLLHPDAARSTPR